MSQGPARASEPSWATATTGRAVALAARWASRNSSRISLGPNGHTCSTLAQIRNAMTPRIVQPSMTRMAMMSGIGDERPDPHHLRHVERGGGEETEGADEPALAYPLCLCAYPPHRTFRALAIHTAARFPGNPP
jgi:hypothetical protein